MRKSLVAGLVLAAVSGASAPGYANEAAGLSSQGQLYMQLQQMQQEIASLRGLLEEQQHQLNRLGEESLERYQALDSRISYGAGDGAAPVEQQASTAAASSSASAAPAQVAGDPAREKEYYEAAYSLVQARDLVRAHQAFTAFLGRYPQGSYAANVHYWLGEIELVNSDLQAAGKSFASVIEGWPKHTKVPDSLYKLAIVEQRLGRHERAESFFRQVINEFPDSSAARLAGQELQRM